MADKTMTTVSSELESDDTLSSPFWKASVMFWFPANSVDEDGYIRVESVSGDCVIFKSVVWVASFGVCVSEMKATSMLF